MRFIDLSNSIYEFELHMTTSIADRVGFPLVVQKIPLALAWRDRTDYEASTNHNCAAAELDVEGNDAL